MRLSRTGREHLRGIKGGLLVASNHRSFLDPFVIGATLPWRRPMQYVAKVELFERPLAGMDPFPGRRIPDPARPVGRDRDGDRAAGAGARRHGLHLPGGDANPLGLAGERPQRGVGRLALEAGAAVVPVAVHGTERVRRGWWIRPRKVKLRVGAPMTFPRTEHPSPALAATVTSRIWPNIELQWEWLGGLPPLRKAAVIGAGSWGTAMAVLLARGGLDVQLGTRSLEKAAEIADKRENSRYLPGVTLPESIAIRRAVRHRARRRRPRLPRGAVGGAAGCGRRRSAIGSARGPRSCC